LAFHTIKGMTYSAIILGAVAASGGDEDDFINYAAEKLSPVNNSIIAFLDMFQFNLPMQYAVSNLMSKAEAYFKDRELHDTETKKYNYTSTVDNTDILGFTYSIQDMYERDFKRVGRDFSSNGLDFSARQFSAVGMAGVDVLAAAGIHLPLMATSKSFMKEYNKINQPLRETVKQRRNFQKP
jgi:hypothetical protein